MADSLFHGSLIFLSQQCLMFCCSLLFVTYHAFFVREPLLEQSPGFSRSCHLVLHFDPVLSIAPAFCYYRLSPI